MSTLTYIPGQYGSPEEAVHYRPLFPGCEVDGLHSITYNQFLEAKTTLGLDAELLVPEEDDISLAERCRRVNTWCQVHGKENAICVSIHFNAYGDGSAWTSPSGWSIYTSIGNTAADRLADCIAKAAAVHLSSMKLRGEWSDGDIDYEEGFYLLRHTSALAP